MPYNFINSGSEAELYHGSDVYDSEFGIDNLFSFTGVVRYDATDLANYSGSNLTQVKFYPRHDTATYTLKVWTGGSYDGTTFVPGTEVVSQEITEFTTLTWNTVELTGYVTLVAGEELWVGIEITAISGYPLGVDEGPAVAGKGELIFLCRKPDYYF